MNKRCLGGYHVVSWSKYEEVALVHLIAGDIGYNPLTDWGFTMDIIGIPVEYCNFGEHLTLSIKIRAYIGNGNGNKIGH
jgi:hypothetical protein